MTNGPEANGQDTVLILLNLSAVADTVDHTLHSDFLHLASKAPHSASGFANMLDFPFLLCCLFDLFLTSPEFDLTALLC